MCVDVGKNKEHRQREMAATFQCNEVIRGCNCSLDPSSNYSSERPDQPVFIANVNFATDPPLGNLWSKSSCLGICESPVSQEAADLCALQQAQLCVFDTLRKPVQGDGYSRRATYYSADQSCVLPCPDGAEYHHALAAGAAISTVSQADADVRAQSICLRQAASTQICFSTGGDLGGSCKGDFFSAVIDASGGVGTLTFALTAGALPTGVTFDAESAVLLGTPTNSGTFSFSLTATDSLGSYTTKPFTMHVMEIVTTSPLPGGNLGVPYNQTLAQAGGIAPIEWTITSGSLPNGLSLDPTTAAITGTPTVPGIFNFEVTAQDQAT